MKKLISIPIILLLVLSSLLINVNAALSSLSWDVDGTLIDSTITKGQSTTFYYTGFTINPPLIIKFDLLDSNNNIIKTYEDRVLASQLNSFSNSYTITSQDYNNVAGNYVIKAYTTDNINQYQIKYIYLNVQDVVQDTTPPTFSAISNIPINPDTTQQVTFSATASDLSGINEIKIFVDGVSIKTCTPGGISPATCSTTAGPYAAGSHSYYFTAKDNSPQLNPATSSTTTFSVITAQDTTPPTVSVAHSPLNPTANQQVTVTANAQDPSGLFDIKIYVDNSLVKTCSNLTLTSCSSNSQLYSTGLHTYYAEARDNSQNKNLGRDPAIGTKSFTVSPIIQQDLPPTLQLINDKIISENNNLQFTITASDPESDPLTLSIINQPQGSAFIQNGNTATFSWTPDFNTVQHPASQKQFMITFKVQETNNPSNSDIEIITITTLDSNRNPTINPISDITANENDLVTITANAQDADNDPLNYSISDQRFTKNNNIFTWQTGNGDAGTYSFIVSTLDNFGGSVFTIVKIVINSISVNHNPQIVSIPVTNARINSLYQYDVNAIDQDNDVLTYSLSTAPVGMNINAATGLITWTPNLAGNYNIVVSVSDGKSGIASQAFTINVLANIPPIANAGPDRTVSINQLITFDGSQSTDPDGNIVEYKWNFGDSTPETTGILATHTYTIKGIYIVTLTVTDNEGSSSQDTAIITANGAPTAEINGPYSGFVNELITVDASQSTDNGVITNYKFDFGDGVIINSITPIVQHTYTNIGLYSLTLTVTDNDGLTGQDTTTVTVSQQIPPPEEKPRKVTIHDFKISNNIIVKENNNGNFIDFYINMKNEGNKPEKIKITGILNGQSANIDVNLDRTETTWQILRFNKPLIKGKYILAVTAENKFNDKDAIYKIIEIN